MEAEVRQVKPRYRQILNHQALCRAKSRIWMVIANRQGEVRVFQAANRNPSSMPEGMTNHWLRYSKDSLWEEVHETR